MKKRLVRDEKNKLVGGVVAGVANYFHQDPVLFRIVAVVLMLLSGVFPFLIVYLIAWITIPIDDGVHYEVHE